MPARVIISILGTEEQGIVLDPYIGSGTTAVAAKLLGHKYIGIDRSEAYIQMTCERLNSSVKEKPKIQEELALHVVETTFKERKAKGENVGKFRPTEEDQLRLFDKSKDQDKGYNL